MKIRSINFVPTVALLIIAFFEYKKSQCFAINNEKAYVTFEKKYFLRFKCGFFDNWQINRQNQFRHDSFDRIYVAF